MSDQENFLTRWSRRKLEPADKQTAEQAPLAADAPPAEPAPPVPQVEVAPEFDISTLPPLDSIGATSDIRAFLQAGVPSALRHAALRRAWSADPAIRDYIGPNENFWEGVGPSGALGFGDLDPNLDVKKLVAEVFGEAEPEPRQAIDFMPTAEQSADISDLAASVASKSAPTEPQQRIAQSTDPLLQRDDNIASQHEALHEEKASATKVRRHGGAMPE